MLVMELSWDDVVGLMKILKLRYETFKFVIKAPRPLGSKLQSCPRCTKYVGSIVSGISLNFSFLLFFYIKARYIVLLIFTSYFINVVVERFHESLLP